MKQTIRARAAATGSVLVLLAACNQDPQRYSSGVKPPPPSAPQTYTVSGSVTGLAGTGLVLRINGGETIPVSNDGPFAFLTAMSAGDSMAVTIASQPSNPAQLCTVSGGTGTISANVTNVMNMMCVEIAGVATPWKPAALVA